MTVTQNRPVSANINRLVLKGAIDVVFRQSSKPSLIVRASSERQAQKIQTKISGSTLEIEFSGSVISIGGGQKTVIACGAGAIAIGGNVIRGGHFVRIGSNTDAYNVIYLDEDGATIETGSAMELLGSIVEISLPNLTEACVKGSGGITIEEINQNSLTLNVQGSGDINISGAVSHLVSRVEGSGDIDASKLVAQSAELSVQGSGDIDARVIQAVNAVVEGSGDITVFGTPEQRREKVRGSGDIRFV